MVRASLLALLLEFATITILVLVACGEEPFATAKILACDRMLSYNSSLLVVAASS